MKKGFAIIIATFLAIVGFSQESFTYQSASDEMVFTQKKKKTIYQSATIELEENDVNSFVAVTPSFHFQDEKSAALVSYRIKKDKKWSAWQSLTIDSHSETKDKIVGTQLYFENGINAIQFNLESNEDLESLTTMKVRFYFPENSSKVKSSEAIFQSKSAQEIDCNCPMPAFEGRLDWCPRGNCPQDATPTPTTVTHLVVHHSAGSNTANDWSAIVRSIWDFHTSGNGWDDVGYNYLIDPNGVIYEGRGNDVQGAHFSCLNGGTMGVCLLGNFNDVEPTTAMLNSLTSILAWKACAIDQDPLESSYFALADTNLENLVGHRDGNNLNGSCTVTSCPGDNVYDILPNIKQQVFNYTDDCSLDETSNLVVLSLEENPTTIEENQTVNLSAVIKNSGDVATSSDFDIRLEVNDSILIVENVTGLNVQETTEISTDYLFENAGTYSVCVYADSPDNELNGLNNSFCKNLTVSSPPPVLINELAELGISIYPNPVKDILTIDSETPISIISLKNMLGQTIISSQENQIDVSALVNGIYILELKVDGKVLTQKIIVE